MIQIRAAEPQAAAGSVAAAVPVPPADSSAAAIQVAVAASAAAAAQTELTNAIFWQSLRPLLWLRRLCYPAVKCRPHSQFSNPRLSLLIRGKKFSYSLLLRLPKRAKISY